MNTAGEKQPMRLAHSNNEPDVFATMNHDQINVRFVPISPLPLQIKKSNIVKTPASTRNETMAPSLFQIALYFEDFIPAAGLKAGLKNPASALRQLPFADLMLYPERLEAVLKSGKKESVAFTPRRAAGQSPAKPATRSAMPRKRSTTASQSVWRQA
jgi:hypothetical protein